MSDGRNQIKSQSAPTKFPKGFEFGSASIVGTKNMFMCEDCQKRRRERYTDKERLLREVRHKNSTRQTDRQLTKLLSNKKPCKNETSHNTDEKKTQQIQHGKQTRKKQNRGDRTEKARPKPVPTKKKNQREQHSSNSAKTAPKQTHSKKTKVRPKKKNTTAFTSCCACASCSTCSTCSSLAQWRTPR